MLACSTSHPKWFANGLKALRSDSKSRCTAFWLLPNFHTAHAMKKITTPRTTRSIASSRRMSRSRNALPRGTMGASVGRSAPLGLPDDEVAAAQAPPRLPVDGLRLKSRGQLGSTPGPTGAYVSCPRRAQWRLFQSRMVSSVGGAAEAWYQVGYSARDIPARCR